jgi:type IV secretory pathway VirB3-like protein
VTTDPAAATGRDGPLRPATCEALNTQPLMLGGLPRKVAGLLAFACIMVVLHLEDIPEVVGTFAVTGMIWMFLRETMAGDMHAFDIWMSWIASDFRFLDARHRGGARLSGAPLRPLPGRDAAAAATPQRKGRPHAVRRPRRPL